MKFNFAIFACFAASLSVFGCASSKGDGNPIPYDSGDDGLVIADTAVDDSGGLVVDGTPPDAPGPGTPSTIYATTNTELWQMDPSTKQVTKVGAFDLGSITKENITDIAVNGKGDLWINSEQHVWTATLPAGGTGAVKTTLKLTLPSTSKFYALGFAPAGVLETDEGLVAGDSNGDLYYIPTSSASPTLQKLGSFGPCRSGDPSPCASGKIWQLSGDVVFYTAGGQPKGLATLRACSQNASGTSYTCDNTNDVVAEIDMVALASKQPGAVLRKQILGGGTNYGRTYGIGAWADKVYAFTYANGGTTPVPAQLITIDGTGAGSLDQVFDTLTGGWTGAGVSTKATITIIQ